MYTDFIYDFDGTISDSYPIFTRSLLNVMKRHGIEDSYENVLQRLKVTMRYAIESYPFAMSTEEIVREYAAEREPLMRSVAKPHTSRSAALKWSTT